MKILGIDTTRKSAKVFLFDSSDVNSSCFLEMGNDVKHSEGLFLFVEKVLVDNNIALEEIDAFACVVGPGSFTGIRVGMSAIKGLNKVLNKSIIVLNSFDMLLSEIKSGLIILNSTNTSCYYAKVEKSEIVETGVVDKSKIVELANGKDIVLLKEEQDLINLEYNNFKMVENLDNLYRDCIIRKMNSGDYGEFVPYYLQLSQAERNLKDE